MSRKFLIIAIATATFVVGFSSTSEAFQFRRRLRNAVVQQNFAPAYYYRAPNYSNGFSNFRNGQSYYGNGYSNYGTSNGTSFLPHNHSANGYDSSNSGVYSNAGFDINGVNGNVNAASATTILSQ